MTETIVLNQIQRDRAEVEKIPAAVFYPGHLLELTSADKLQKHALAGGSVAPIMFALEDENQGLGIETPFAITGRCVAWIPQPGDEVYAVLKDGENVVIGDKLESAGGGLLQKYVADTVDSATGITVYDKQIVGQAIEALDLSGSSGTESSVAPLGYDKRIKIRIC